MAQTGYTPILIYASGSTGNTPSAANLTSSASGAELAINYFDGKLFYKDNSGVVQVLATKGTAAIGGSDTQVQYNSSGSLAGSSNLTFNGTTLTSAGFSGPLNGSVGATTPSTGAFTTLSASSTVTLSGGTANGVLYLNGSKVATSGSAITFDGTNFATTGSATATALIPSGSSVPTNGMYLPAANTVAWSTNTTERARIDSSGNLGIGTTSPVGRLRLAGSSATAFPNQGGCLWLTDTNAASNEKNWAIASSSGALTIFTGSDTFSGGQSAYKITRTTTTETASEHIWYTGATVERARITSSGDLLINTTSAVSGSKLVVASADATIYGITVGRGAGAVSTNTVVGASALNANTTGNTNVAVGASSLLANTTGNNNTAIGYEAARNNTTSSLIVAVGYQAAKNSTGSYDIAIGGLALGGNATSSGGQNIAIGGYALYSNTTGKHNIAIGHVEGNAGQSPLNKNTTGQRNIAIGSMALNENISGTDNVSVGYQALYYSTGNNNTAVGNSAALNTTGANNTAVGYLAGYLITTGGKNTILGGYSGNQDGLDIRTASNYAIISDGDGNRLLSTANGYTLALDGGAVPQTGTGITFPATQSASSDANTLDDYEEGTFTPTVSGSTSAGTGTYTTQVGAYTKVGRQVSINIWVVWTAHTGTGNLQITNLPFTSNSTTSLYNSVTIGYANNVALTANNVLLAHNPNNTTRIDFYQYPVGGGANSQVPIDTDASVMVSATYFV